MQIYEQQQHLLSHVKFVRVHHYCKSFVVLSSQSHAPTAPPIFEPFSGRSSPTVRKPTREGNPVCSDWHTPRGPAIAPPVLRVHIVLRQNDRIHRPHPRRSPVLHHPVVLQFLWSRAKHAGTCPPEVTPVGTWPVEQRFWLPCALRFVNLAGRKGIVSSVLSLRPGIIGMDRRTIDSC